jgi:hypothetical protein
MGLTVTEDIELNNGLNVESYYASINTNDLTIRKSSIPKTTTTTDPTIGAVTSTTTTSTVYTVTTTSTVYTVTSRLNLWVSKEARDTNKQSIQDRYVTIEQETPITGNVYELLYAKYKEDHPNAVDA